MRDEIAIRLDGVSKVYRLFGNQRQQLMEVLGLRRFLRGGGKHVKEFSALTDVSLEIPKGARVGVLGRNGAGKTTLLKLVSGNFAPTTGTVEVSGTVQALMGTGLGFHPEYTGRENAAASLQYNGLTRAEYDAAVADIIDFCELGDFIDQPFKTYSLGMQARLMFATSTAIRPDILIVDEVLGAGDGYFIAKSRRRMEKLVSSGCTMLLVSHSTQQVLELCETAVWLHQGAIRMTGEAFEVVKAYEEYIHETTRGLAPAPTPAPRQEKPPTAPRRGPQAVAAAPGAHLQEPVFQPHGELAALPASQPAADDFPYLARGGLSRWEGEAGLKFRGVDFRNRGGSSATLMSLEPMEVRMTIEVERAGHYRCRYGFVVNDIHGRVVSKVFSPPDEFDGEAGMRRDIAMTLNPLQLGPGEYSCGVCVWDYGPLELINTARRYDLLSRSFEIKVEVPDSLSPTGCLFYHSAEWQFEAAAPAPPAGSAQALPEQQLLPQEGEVR